MPVNKSCRMGTALIWCILIGIITPFQAQASDFHSPRTDGLGGAGHAGPHLNDTIYLNPSFSSFVPVRAFSFSYSLYAGPLVNTPAGMSDYYGNNMNLSVLDGTSDSLFQAGIGYTRRSDSSFIHIGASKSFLQRYGAGIGAKFVFPNDTGERITDASFSFSAVATNWLQAALVVDNLFESGASRGLNREYILGTKLNVMGIVLVYLDPHYAPTVPGQSPFGYEAGSEFPFFSDFFLRLGTFKSASIPHQGQRGDGYGAGVGWVAPRLSLDYGYSRALSPLSTYAHNFQMTVFF